MKYIDQFFMKSNLILVWIITTVVCGIGFKICWWTMDVIGNTHNTHMYWLGFILFGILLGTIVTSLLYLMRSAEHFHSLATQIENDIKLAKTKAALMNIFNNDFQKLSKMSFHRTTGQRLHLIYARLETKYNTLND